MASRGVGAKWSQVWLSVAKCRQVSKCCFVDFEPVAVNIPVIPVVPRRSSRNSKSLAFVVSVFRYISYIHILYNRYRQTRTFWVQENEAVSCMSASRGDVKRRKINDC